MLAKRVIPCLDVKDNKVVKGVKFRNHIVMGDITELASRYQKEGADELVFYDITASTKGTCVDKSWVRQIARILDIPFCVAGGITTVDLAQKILEAGADKISINSPALENPDFINELVNKFGSQCVVVGVDSYEIDGEYFVYQYTGDPNKMQATKRRTVEWIKEVQARGAGEIVLNCMNQDGVRQGYDIKQLNYMKSHLKIPLIASGGAGCKTDFVNVFQQTKVQGALAASVFHRGEIGIDELKRYLKKQNIEVRL